MRDSGAVAADFGSAADGSDTATAGGDGFRGAREPAANATTGTATAVAATEPASTTRREWTGTARPFLTDCGPGAR